jgi:hypothetical protein
VAAGDGGARHGLALAMTTDRASRFACLLGLTAILAAAPVATARAQGVATSDAWLAAVRSHAPGAVDQAVVTVSRWPRGVALATVRKGLRETADPAVLQRALILHTDAAIAERAAFEAGGRLGPGRGALLLDARTVGSLPRSAHWEVGREIAAALMARPGGPAVVRRWYRATGALLQQWADCGALRPHLDAALRLLPDDAVLLMYDATLHQTYADPRVQRFFRPVTELLSDGEANGGVGVRRDAQGFEVGSSIGSTPMMTSQGRRGSMTVAVGAASDELGRAERSLRRAAELDSGLIEARVRLAHVLLRRGQPGEALPLAEAALGAPLPPFLEYYGAMVLGLSADAVGRAADARRAYERAAAVFPLAQSARVGISRQALEGSHAADGLTAIVAAAGPKAARDTGDPWWSYFRVHEPNATAQIAAWRSLAP